MENLTIHKTTKSPKVKLDVSGLIEISGNSLLENTQSFFSPILDWIKDYVKHPANETIVNFAMDYYNTSSQMWIFQLFNALTDLFRLEKKITVNWYYTDIDLRESGEDLAHLLNIKLNFIEKEAE